MSHDDRIRQLTSLFIEDLRSPIEGSLRQLLAQMMGLASQEQNAAVEETLARAAAQHDEAVASAVEAARQEHQAALAAAVAFAAQQRDMALEALEAELAQRHGVALDAALTFANQQRDMALEALEAHLLKQHADASEAQRAEREQALHALRVQSDQQQAEALDALRAELNLAHEKALDELRLEMGNRHEEMLASITVEAEAEHDGRLQALHDELTREHEAALAGLREQIEHEHEVRMAQLLETLAAEHEAERDERRDGPAGAAAASGADALAAALMERDAARASVAELTDHLAAARAQHEQLTQLAHAESAAAEQLFAGPADARAEEREFDLACSERLLNAIRDLDAARTLSDILQVMTDHVASESLRGAVLLMQAGRLRGWCATGLGDVHASSIEVPLDSAGFLGEAAQRGVPVATTAADGASAVFPPFAAPPADRVGLAVPILVGGHTVAVLYVDNGNTETPVVPSNWPEQVEILTRHAGRCLEALTLARANGVAPRAPQEMRAAVRPAPAAPAAVRETDEAQEEESARRHARLLISEIKLYNEILVEQGRREGNLLGLLGAEIERARRLYEEKIPAAVRERVNCFDDEIVRTLAGGDRALLGQGQVT